jgi:Fe2+ transport system protein FeoA
MSILDIQCPMCGQSYNPDQHIGCENCPLHSGCALVCCPTCGYQTVNLRKSKAARLVQSLFTLGASSRNFNSLSGRTTLADVTPGRKVKIIGFSPGFPPDRREYLQAYGLVENYQVQVLQHSPVTIVRLDHIELALEIDLARGILVESELPGTGDNLPQDAQDS